MSRRWGIGLGIAIGVVAALLVVLAAFPWGMLRGVIAREATERFGRPVAIGAVERLDGFGFRPRLAVRDVRIAQADWAGTGDFAQVRTLAFTLPVWPLLTGDARPTDVVVDGLRLRLARRRDGVTNWQRPGKPDRGGGSTDLGAITVHDAHIAYADAKGDRSAQLAVAIDPARGLSATGTGTIARTPVRIAIRGARPVAGRPWPFRATIAGTGLDMRAGGVMDRPLDTGAMTLDVTARAADLKQIDTVIEAGLFHTRPVAIEARVRHDTGADKETWRIERLSGTIGRSDLRGKLTVDKIDGRSKIDGRVASRAFDFNDLTSAEGRARAAALEARIGSRLVPNTRVDIGKIDSTDGRLAFRVGRVIGANNPPVLGMAGVLTLDHRLLTLAPLRLSLSQGTVTGRAVVDQRGGRPAPIVTLDLRLAGGDVAAFAAGGQFSGKLVARVRLRGTGKTIRDAVGRSDGMIGLAVTGGRLPARYAAALGFDAGRALLTDAGERAPLRCLIARVAMRDGTGRIAPLTIDTAISRLGGSGTVRFPDERLALTLRGAPKRDVVLRIPGTATVGGTIQQPDLSIPSEVKSVGNILKAIGRRITGNSGPVATDANCGALAVQALR